MTKGIKNEVAWVTASTLVSAAVLALIYAVLSVNVSSSVLGQLAIINVVIMIAFILQDAGLSSFLIYRQSLTDEERASVYWLNVAFGILTAGMVFVGAFFVGDFYHSEELTTSLQIVSLSFVISGASAQFVALCIKNLEQKRLAVIEICSKVSMLLVSVSGILAYQLELNAYLYGIVIGAMVKLVLFLIVVPSNWKPSLNIHFGIIHKAVRYGAFQLSSQIVNQIRTHLDQLIIGKAISLEVLGVYFLAKEIVTQPMKLLNPVISKIVMPRLSRIQDKPSQLQSTVLRAVHVILLVNGLIFTLLLAAVEFVLPHYLGSDYAQLPVLFAVLVLIGFVRPIGSCFGVLAQAVGRTDAEFYWNIMAGIVILGASLIALWVGNIFAFAVAAAAGQWLLSFLSIFYFSRVIGTVSLYKALPALLALSIWYLLLNFMLI